MKWYYISFAGEDEWLGACFVQALSLLEACQEAWKQGCNPGGEAAILELSEEDLIKPEFVKATKNKLLTRKDLESSGPVENVWI